MSETLTQIGLYACLCALLALGGTLLTAFIHDLWVYRKEVRAWFLRDVMRR